MATLEERVERLEADLPTRKGYVAHLEALQQGQRLINQRLGVVEGDVAELKMDMTELKTDVKLILQHFKIET